MDRDTAVTIAQQAIKLRNRRIIDAVLERQAENGPPGRRDAPAGDLPLIGVTCSTGWECYAIVQELVNTRRFRVRALFRTPGTQAAARLDDLLTETERTHPGLLTLLSGTDLRSAETLTEAFAGCDGVVLYVTANSESAGKVNNHATDPVGGRRVVMEQVMAMRAAIKANPSITHAVTLVFPPDKVHGIADDAPPAPWWIQQRLRLSDFLRDDGINVTCLHRPAYYFAMHRVDYTAKADFRGETKLSRTMIRENNVPGIMEPDFMVNWVDVRDVGKWIGTIFEHPGVFSNEDFSIASTALTGRQRVDIATQVNKHGTTFEYKQFPKAVMRMLAMFNNEVSYPLITTRWYNDKANGYDFASVDDLEDLAKIHPPWTFEDKLASWGIDELRPGTG